jgi:hypothetical protein
MIPELSRGLSLHEAGAADALPPPPALNFLQIRVHLSTSYGRRITLHGEEFYPCKVILGRGSELRQPLDSKAPPDYVSNTTYVDMDPGRAARKVLWWRRVVGGYLLR